LQPKEHAFAYINVASYMSSKAVNAGRRGFDLVYKVVIVERLFKINEKLLGMFKKFPSVLGAQSLHWQHPVNFQMYNKRPKDDYYGGIQSSLNSLE